MTDKRPAAEEPDPRARLLAQLMLERFGTAPRTIRTDEGEAT